MAVANGFEPLVVIPLAPGDSTAMCLPISIPPNAIAFVPGNLKTIDLLKDGLVPGLLD
ncbi:MAG: hypothetical protein HQ508_02880 [Candidatus Marinimicrobia bacterium]|nr:hypothetical protein [Candidatus Neomarinimicrobiota bacterium]